MILTDQEREKFATWLEQDAASNEAIARQLSELPYHAALHSHLLTEAAAE